MFITLYKTNKKVQEQSETIHSLQKQINLLGLARSDNSEVWSEQMQLFMDETIANETIIEKKIKKMEQKVYRLEKELKAFE
jgi:predicted RNase H-like nuclease (RuvC/YqgF family)